MQATAATRKPVDQLTGQDFEAFPVWEFAEDEERVEDRDETWVRPLVSSVVPRRVSPCGVRADLVTADGRTLQGLAWVNDFEIAGGAAFVQDAYCYFNVSDEEVLAADMRARFLLALGADMASVFPMTYRLAVPFEDEFEARTGQIR